jgi:hypothetical protein
MPPVRGRLPSQCVLHHHSKREFMNFCEFWRSSAPANRGSEAADFPVRARAPMRKHAPLALAIAAAQLLTSMGAGAQSNSANDSENRDSFGRQINNSNSLNGNTNANEGAPIRLTAPRATGDTQQQDGFAQGRRESFVPYVPSEFERYVQKAVGGSADLDRNGEIEIKVRRFGSELMSPSARNSMAQEASTQIPSGLPDQRRRRGARHDLGLGRGRPAAHRRPRRPHQHPARRPGDGGRRALRRPGTSHRAARRPGVPQLQAQRLAGQVAQHPRLRDRLHPAPGAYTVSSLSTMVNA